MTEYEKEKYMKVLNELYTIVGNNNDKIKYIENSKFNDEKNNFKIYLEETNNRIKISVNNILKIISRKDIKWDRYDVEFFIQDKLGREYILEKYKLSSKKLVEYIFKELIDFKKYYEKILEKSDISFKQEIYLKINKLRNFNKYTKLDFLKEIREDIEDIYNGNISWNQFINNLIDKKDYIFCEIDFILESFNKKQII